MQLDLCQSVARHPSQIYLNIYIYIFAVEVRSYACVCVWIGTWGMCIVDWYAYCI